MSIGRRIKRIVRASKASAQDAGTDPMLAAQQVQQAQQQSLESARRAAADLAAHRRRLEIITQDAAARVRYFEAQAGAAVDRGDDATARTAIREAMNAGKHLATVSAQFEEADAQARRIAADVGRLERRVYENALQYQAIAAQRKRAEASLGVQEALNAASRPVPGAELAAREAEREARRLAAIAAAREELAWSDSTSLRVEEAFEELEADTAAGEELARLKERRPKGYPPGQQ